MARGGLSRDEKLPACQPAAAASSVDAAVARTERNPRQQQQQHRRKLDADQRSRLTLAASGLQVDYWQTGSFSVCPTLMCWRLSPFMSAPSCTLEQCSLRTMLSRVSPRRTL